MDIRVETLDIRVWTLDIRVWTLEQPVVTMGPVSLMKLTRKRKLVRTLDYFLDFFPQLISTNRSRDSPPVYWCPVLTMVTMGLVCLMKLTR